MRRWSIPLLILAMLAVSGVALAARAHSAGTPIGGVGGAHSVATPTAAAPLPPTRLLALPGHAIANGTEPLTVTLSAPVSPTSPPPSLNPKVAGRWSIVGDSEVFTPASTLEPCSSYTLTVWAGTSATGHARLSAAAHAHA